MAELAARPWPGNVRELRNALERAAALGEIEPASPLAPTESDASAPAPAAVAHEVAPEVAADPAVPFKTGKAMLVDRYERAYVEALMQRHGGNITQAARAAEIDRVYLLRLLDKFGMRATKRGQQ